MSQALRRMRLLAVALAGLMVLAACGGASPDAEAPAAPEVDAGERAEEEAPADLDAAGLRAALNNELRVHTYLAAAAANAALAGNNRSFEAAATEIKEGSAADIADLVGSLYGPQVREDFLDLWNSQTDMFLDYTAGIAVGDQAKAGAAVERLTAYAQTLADTFEQLTEGDLPARVSQPLILEHITGLKAVADAQKAAFASKSAEDFNVVYAQLRQAMAHMDMIAEPLASAIAVRKHIPGAVDGDAAEARVALNALLAEHVLLTGSFTGQTLAGNTAAAEGAKAAVGANADALSDTIGRVYGQDTAADFNRLWTAHSATFADYTTGIAVDDRAKADMAVQRLMTDTEALADALEQITTLPADASQPLIVEHVTTLKTVIDAQKAKDFPAAFSALHEAAHQMQDIADALASTIA